MSIEKIVEGLKMNEDTDETISVSKLDAAEKFERFCKGKKLKIINNIEENDFVQLRSRPGQWSYSPDSRKELSKAQEELAGTVPGLQDKLWSTPRKEKKPKSVTEDVILQIYESEIKGKFTKEEKVKKDVIEDKYSKWL